MGVLMSLHDKGHNRTQKSVSVNSAAFIDHDYQFGTTTDGYNSNQLKSYNRPDSGETVSILYDADGNRISKTARIDHTATSYSFESQDYGFDQDNRLVEVLENNGGGALSDGEWITTLSVPTVVGEYLYDARTRRVLRDETGGSGDITRLAFLGGTSVAEYDAADPVASATPQVEFVRANGMGGGVGSVLYSLRNNVLSSTHYNSRGDVTARADATGSFTYTAAYEAFGTHESETGTNPDRQQANTKRKPKGASSIRLNQDDFLDFFVGGFWAWRCLPRSKLRFEQTGF